MLMVKLVLSRFTGALLSAVGMAIALLLTISHLRGSEVPCGLSSGCAEVAAHPSSMIGPVPVAALGLLCYGLIFSTFFIGGGAAGIVRALLSWAGVFTSTYLLYLSHFVVGSYCLWCLASGLTMLILAGHSFATIGSVSMGSSRLWMATLLLLPVSAGAYQMSRPADGAMGRWRTVEVNQEELLPEDLVWQGDPEAAVSVIQFTDFTCSACRKGHAETARILDRYRGSIRYTIRHLPMFEIKGHELSVPAAILAEVAKSDGKLFEFVDAAFQGSSLSEDSLFGGATSLGMPKSRIQEELSDARSANVARVKRDLEFALSLDIRTTPTFLVHRRGEADALVMSASALLLALKAKLRHE